MNERHEREVPPWRNVTVKYCPTCQRVRPSDAERCPRCGGQLVERIERRKVHRK